MRLGIFAAAAMMILGHAPGAAGAPAEESSKGKPWYDSVKFSGKFAFEAAYDDNVVHYSGVDLAEFESVLNVGKYSITKAGDWILRPRLELEAKTKGWGGESLSLDATLSSWRYVWNDIKNNESYDVTLKHGAWGVSNFQLGFYHAPMYYIRNFRDRDPFTSIATPLGYKDFSLTSNSMYLGFWKKYTNRIRGKIELRRAWRYFNQAFMENDNWEWRITGYVQYSLFDFLEVKGEYAYSDVKGRGADSAGETRENSDDSDPSYERDAYAFDLLYAFPKKNPLRLSGLNLKFDYQIYYFTSAKRIEEDPFHVGRKDKVYRFEAIGNTRPVLGQVSLQGGYRYTERTSTAPEASAGEDIGEEKDYKDNRYWFGVEYPF
ncbi:MAG: hypothetical protein ABIK65_16255 [Candidatus Eisenbacteria bacterium]